MLSGKISNKSDLMSGENFKKADSKPKKYPTHSKNHLKPVFNNCHKVQFQRNLKYRLSEQMTHFPNFGHHNNFHQSVDFGPKNSYFTPFWA